MPERVSRRHVVAATGLSVLGAGCLGGGGGGSGADESGTVEEPDQARHTLEVTAGDDIRVEVTNQEGVATLVELIDPDYETIVDEEVEADATFTDEAGREGAYRVIIEPFGRASYEIYVD